MSKIVLYSILVFFGFTLPAHAQTATPNGVRWENSSAPCWEAAGAYHGIDPWLLYSIAKVESEFNPNAINKANTNGTKDMGLMQINSVHLPQLRKYGIDEKQLFHACKSTFIGAWIMAEKIRRYGYTWEAIAAYNVGSLNTPGRVATGKKYASKVLMQYQKLTAANGYKVPR